MSKHLLGTLSLLDPSAYVIIAAILVLLGAGFATTFVARRRYAALEREVARHTSADLPFRSPVLNRIVHDARQARRDRGEVNAQAIIDVAFQDELKGLLVGERFVKSVTGLLIIFGLVGTFYGLTLSIGRLVGLVSGDMAGTTDVAEALTRGLRQALAGMSVAFSTSLFGIVSAISMTLVGVFANIADRRTAAMVRIEAYLDHVILASAREGGPEIGAGAGERTGAAGLHGQKLESVVGDFGQSVLRLENAIARFDAALTRFATTTRDFQEFNLHLKDNIQRMSLSFGDFSDMLKVRIGAPLLEPRAAAADGEASAAAVRRRDAP